MEQIKNKTRNVEKVTFYNSVEEIWNCNICKPTNRIYQYTVSLKLITCNIWLTNSLTLWWDLKYSYTCTCIP